MILLVAPALPLHTAGKYVAAAYIVFFALILIYVAIMATRLGRIERELSDLLERFDRDTNLEPPSERGDVLEHAMPIAEAELSDAQESARV